MYIQYTYVRCNKSIKFLTNPITPLLILVLELLHVLDGFNAEILFLSPLNFLDYKARLISLISLTGLFVIR